MPVMTEAPGAKKARFKMRLINDEFTSEYGTRNWNKAGSVIVVDEDTAIRWLENHIAVQAGRDEKTAEEIRRAELLATLEAVDDDEDEAPLPVRRASASRQAPAAKQPARKPTRRLVGDVQPQLVGAGVINSLVDAPDDESDDEDEG